MTSHAHNDITHTYTQSHTPRYHSGGDKTHAVRGCNAISARRAGKSLKVDFHGQQWDNRGSDGHRVHCIHGDVEGIGGLLKQPTCPWPSQRLLPTGGDCTSLAPTYKLNMTDEF